MKLFPDRLESHLERNIAPVYLLHGEEPLQIMEAADKIRAHAKQLGFTERTVFQPADENDWAMLRESADSLSLFSDKRIIELRLPNGKPGRAGGDTLKQYCNSPHADVLLLVSSGKIDRSGQSSAWFKAIDKAGVTMISITPSGNQFTQWLRDRLGAQGLVPEPDALAVIAERTEGNLAAARQEVERLALLYPAGQLSCGQVMDAVADSARYSIADLVQAALGGHTGRAVKVLNGLQEEGAAEILVLFSLSQEIRSGARTAEAMEAGVAEEAALKSAGVWQNRKGPLKQALRRHQPQVWLSMLSSCSAIDRHIKGQVVGAAHVNVWDALCSLVVKLSGAGETPLNMNHKIPL
ncbi:MAG: DNA polymerase III subunit delta [Granulosicoccus sp.]